MASEHHPFRGIFTSLPKPGGGEFGKFYSLPALNDPRIEKLPYCITIVVESAIRNCDNFQITEDDVSRIIDWETTSAHHVDIPFKPARVLLQDFTGVPAVVDLAAMCDAMKELGSNPDNINPLVPVDLVIDHSVHADVARSENALKANMDLEFKRNKERFAFLKWGSNAFHNMLIIPAGSGIVHQVNLEYLGRVVFNSDGVLYPDSVVGTDSHTPMIDALGIAGWGVGGIEAEATMLGQFVFRGHPGELKHGSIVIAAITSCTNTSNPSVMLGAGLVAKKACELGLEVKPWIKTSLAPGSGAVTKYLQKSGLQKYLNQLGFYTVGYGCTTCIGNFEKEPIGPGKDGKSVYFKDIWPSNEEIAEVVQSNVLPDMFKSTYEAITDGNPFWNELSVPSSNLYAWDPNSTYIHQPPYFKGMSLNPSHPCGVKDAYCLLNFGDGITTDQISPPGGIHKDSPAARYLMEHGVDPKDFNSYGSRRGNDEVMARGTFAHMRIINKLLNGEVGPKTIHIPSGDKLYVYDAAMRYKSAGQDTIIMAGAEYGTGSSRDWAAKGPMLLGVKAVIAKSFETIHRSNLVGMGIIPLCFKRGEDAETLGLTGRERYTIGLPHKISDIRPGQDITVTTNTDKSFTCVLRFDTKVELAYFDHGGILHYVIRNLIKQ